MGTPRQECGTTTGTAAAWSHGDALVKRLRKQPAKKQNKQMEVEKDTLVLGCGGRQYRSAGEGCHCCC